MRIHGRIPGYPNCSMMMERRLERLRVLFPFEDRGRVPLFHLFHIPPYIQVKQLVFFARVRMERWNRYGVFEWEGCSICVPLRWNGGTNGWG